MLPQDHALALSSLEGAAQRLREAIAFSRGDPQPHNALGDTLMARADLAGDPSEALGFLNASLQEGYSAALRLNSQDANAHVGSAEVLLPPCPHMYTLLLACIKYFLVNKSAQRHLLSAVAHDNMLSACEMVQ